jgi:hypothetical protein
MSVTEKKTSLWSLVVAWVIVTIPLCWGVSQSVIKSLPLFQKSEVSGGLNQRR